ncbi:hypothetical protein F3Y22_tig00111213pilonHSYRG00503 [Hibiscus syriacus]|uniref:FMN hydroxy acid dehydrogenase domain-containing protein n=1 Tax=Hibiscus syriacus TaxID=106335 RepID=A0A6A2YV40_HIBSY|nr:hypothetical protein F3Y22_tig00111213pilonHSYRG00503 [Hibiscus syriacus]
MKNLAKGGAEDEHTPKENVEEFQRIKIWPRIIVDVSRTDLSTIVLGRVSNRGRGPIFGYFGFTVIAAVAGAIAAVADAIAAVAGEVATARAAAACRVVPLRRLLRATMVFGSSRYMSSCTIEEVASSYNGVRFFQIYVYKKRDITATLVQRAERCGYKAIVVTVDTPRLGRRQRLCSPML